MFFHVVVVGGGVLVLVLALLVLASRAQFAFEGKPLGTLRARHSSFGPLHSVSSSLPPHSFFFFVGFFFPNLKKKKNASFTAHSSS